MNKLNLLFLLPICLLLACSKEEIRVGGNTPTTPPVITEVDTTVVDVDTMTYSLLALGDSYTFGSGLLESQSWPFQLVDEFNATEVKITELDVIAQSGWTTAVLIDQINQANPTPHDLVTLLIGVNDQFQGRTFEQFTTGFDALLSTAIELANGRENVIVISIPDYGVTPFGANNAVQIAEELDAFNAYILQQCMVEAVPYIDVTTISRTLGAGENALAPDNLHPSAEQYRQWNELIFPVAMEKLID